MSTKEGKRIRSDFSIKLKDGFELNLRFWLSKNKKIVVASGRVGLLENIKKFGSLSRAAKEMNISYRHAWLLIDGMNKTLGKKVTRTRIGGVRGGGTEITEEGRKLIDRFYSLKRIIGDKLRNVE